jgi:hypothetical protein
MLGFVYERFSSGRNLHQGDSSKDALNGRAWPINGRDLVREIAQEKVSLRDVQSFALCGFDGMSRLESVWIMVFWIGTTSAITLAQL